MSKSFDAVCREYCLGQTVSIAIGRNRNSAGPVGAPVVLVDGGQQPKLVGHPYLKTQFRNGAFTKTLYTPSSRRIEVGRDWQPQKR